jgi:hypothetical protein
VFFGPRFEQAPQGKTKQKTRVMLVLFSGPGSGTAPYGEQLNPRMKFDSFAQDPENNLEAKN